MLKRLKTLWNSNLHQTLTCHGLTVLCPFVSPSWILLLFSCFCLHMCSGWQQGIRTHLQLINPPVLKPSSCSIALPVCQLISNGIEPTPELCRHCETMFTLHLIPCGFFLCSMVLTVLTHPKKPSVCSDPAPWKINYQFTSQLQ